MMKYATYLLSVAFFASINGCSSSNSPPTAENAADDVADDASQAVGNNSTGLPAINENNYDEFLAQAFEIYFGTAYDQRLPTAHVEPLRSGNPIAERETSDGPATILYKTYACANGGTVEHNTVIGVSPIISYGYVAQQCQHNADVISGTFAHGGYRETSHDNISLKSYSVKFGSDNDMTADGQYRRYNGFFGYNNSPYNYTRHWVTDAFSYQISYLGDALSVTDATTDAWYGYSGHDKQDDQFFWKYYANLEGSFTMQTPFSDSTIEVSTPVALTQDDLTTELAKNNFRPPTDMPPLPRFTNGTLLLLASDGSSVTLDARNASTGLPTVVVSNGVASQTFSTSWDTYDNAMALRDITLQFPAEI